MGNALRCLESCAAERLNWEHNNTETWQSGGGPDSSHFYSSSSPTSVLRDDHGAGVHRRGCGSLSEHAGRRFLLRWQVGFAHGAQQRRYQQHHHPLLHLSSPLVTFPLKRRGGGTGRCCPHVCFCLSLVINHCLFSSCGQRHKAGEIKGEHTEIRTENWSHVTKIFMRSTPISWTELLLLIVPNARVIFIVEKVQKNLYIVIIIII